MTPQESDEEKSGNNNAEDVVENIVQRFIGEQGTSPTNLLKIEVIDNPKQKKEMSYPS